MKKIKKKSIRCINIAQNSGAPMYHGSFYWRFIIFFFPFQMLNKDFLWDKNKTKTKDK